MRVKEKFGLKNYQKKVWSITVWVVQGDPIKMRLGFCSIALAILIQQDLDYILLKTDIHSFQSQFLGTYDSTEILIFSELLIYSLKNDLYK